MRKLDLYLIRELLAPFSACLAGLIGFWIFGDLIERLESFHEYGAKTTFIVAYYWRKLPEFLLLLLPIALLFSQLYSMTRLSASHQFTAMRASGISLTRINAPYFAFAGILACLMVTLNEIALPTGDKMTSEMETLLTNKDRKTQSTGRSLVASNQAENRSWIIESYDPILKEMSGLVRMDWERPDQTMLIIRADSATWNGENWVFHDGRAFEPFSTPDRITFDHHIVPELNETPKYFDSWIQLSRLEDPRKVKDVALSLKQIRQLSKALDPDVDPAFKKLNARLHANLSLPMTPLIIALFAAPFAARSNRRDLFVSVANRLALGIVYLYSQEFLLPLGASGRMEPVLAAWSPHILFAILGFGLFARAKN